MATKDKCCMIVPYFKISSGKLKAFKRLCEQFVEKTNKEPKCLYYGFSFYEDQAHCRPNSSGNSWSRKRTGKAPGTSI